MSFVNVSTLQTLSVGRTAGTSDAGASNAPAVNVAATIVINAVAEKSICVRGIEWSYNATPTGGAINVSAGGVPLGNPFITTGGPGFLPSTYKAPVNTNISVTLAAGGAAVLGSLRVDQIWLE